MTAHGPCSQHRIVVLHGKDSFLRLEWSHRLRESLKEKFGAFDEFEFDGSTASLASVLDELRSYGLMCSHKLVVVDNADAFLGAEDRRRAMERYAQAPMKEATLLLRAQNWRPGNFDKLVAACGIVQKCESPGDADAAKWCISRCDKAYQIQIEPLAATLLVERVGCDLARLDSELAKLTVAGLGSGASKVTRATVVDMVGASREEQAWEIQEAILSGPAAMTVKRLLDLLRVSKAPEVMLAWSAIDLARKVHAAAVLAVQGVPDGQIARELRLWGPSTQPIIAAGRSIGAAHAAGLLHLALEADRQMKTGGSPDPERALLGLCTTLGDSMSGRKST